MHKLILFVALMVMGCNSPTGPGGWWNMNMYAVETYGPGYWTVYWDAPEFDIYEAQNVYLQIDWQDDAPITIDGTNAIDIIASGSMEFVPLSESEWYLMHAEYQGNVYEETLYFSVW